MNPDSLAVVATAVSGPTILDQIAAALAALTPVISFLVATGLVYKYVPFLAKLPNNLIPFLNSLIAFLTVFMGGVPAAHAGLFGDFVHTLSGPAKVAGSFLVSAAASGLYEVFIRPTLDKLGIKKAIAK